MYFCFTTELKKSVYHTRAYMCIHKHDAAVCGYLTLFSEKSEALIRVKYCLSARTPQNGNYCGSIQFKDLFLIPGDIIPFHHHFLFPALHHSPPLCSGSDQTMTCYKLWDFHVLDSQHNTDISVDCEGRSLKYFSITWMSVSDTLNYVHNHRVSSVSYV